MAEVNEFPVISSAIDMRLPQFQLNVEAWQSILQKFEDSLKAAAIEGNQKSLDNHQSRGQVLVLKQNRVTAIATECRLPIVALVQSAGVFLPQQFRVFHPGGQIFRDLAIRTGEGQYSCAVVFGSSTAGGAYHPALSDYTIFVDGQAQVFLGGPPLVKMATGEVIGAEELGGARTHAQLTGLADQLAEDEFSALRKAREWVASLPSQDLSVCGQRLSQVIPPRYPAEELLSLMDPDIRKPFDMQEALLRIVDDSRLSIFKPGYGSNLITTWARIM
ncbi:hypothetical protein ZTR_10601, partial [Talaromyces verruculosus]